MHNTACFLHPAVECVKALQANTTRSSNVFRDPRNTSVASAMSMLSHTAQFIEQSVNNNNQLHNVSILIACRVRKENTTSTNPTFVMWNTITEATQNNRNTSTIQESQHAPQQTLETNETTSDPETAQHPNSHPSQPPLSQTPTLLEADETYTVPVQIASKCLQLLLDGSGFSSHKNLFQSACFEELGSKLLEDVIRKVFKAERERRSKAPGSSTSDPAIVQSTKGYEMIYLDLLPDHLRQKKGEQGITVSVPQIALSPNGSAIVSKMMKVGMSIKKPDRNTKNQNFALLCTILDHTGSQGICAKVLREYAQEGFSHEGCKRRKKFSTSTKSNCNGLQSCGLSEKQLCSFYIPTNDKPVGKGIVDPFITSLDDKAIPNGYFLVRFGSIVNIKDLTFPSNLTEPGKRELHSRWQTGPTIWQKDRIERIELLGDFEKVIGSAILVQDLIPSGAHPSILRRVQRRRLSNNAVDVANAIVVCDIILLENRQAEQEPQRYPYMEWYQIPSLSMLKVLHLNNKDPPNILTSNNLREITALLWSRDKYKRSGQV